MTTSWPGQGGNDLDNYVIDYFDEVEGADRPYVEWHFNKQEGSPTFGFVVRLTMDTSDISDSEDNFARVDAAMTALLSTLRTAYPKTSGPSDPNDGVFGSRTLHHPQGRIAGPAWSATP